MADAATTIATTEVPAKASGGFPPFDTSTYPSQLFWLAITFTCLFLVLWRLAGPRIHDVITARRGRINDDLASAQAARKAAEEAAGAYQTALAGARARAQALADENRKVLDGEIAAAKAEADAAANAAMAEADARIAATSEKARGHIVKAAAEAAAAIVARLTGDTVSGEEAARAVGKG